MQSIFRARTTLWVFLTAVVTSVVLLLIAFLPVSGDALTPIKEGIDELRREAESRRLPRSVLFGKAIPGNAWEDYRKAFNGIRPWTEHANAYVATLARFASGKATREETESALNALAYLHSGAQREDGQYPHHWDSEPDFLAERGLPRLAAAQSKALTDARRSREALELELDLAVFARDRTANGTLFSQANGAEVYAMAFNALHDSMTSGKLRPADFADLAARLEIVDRDFPDLEPALANDTLVRWMNLLVFANQPRALMDLPEQLRFGEWCYAFSSKKMALDAFETSKGYLKRSRELGRIQFSTALAEAEDIFSEAQNSPNHLTRNTESLVDILIAHRVVQTKLRLLRAAALWAATGKAPKVADPFGADVFGSESAGAIRIWSVGPDGKNQNGSGGWEVERLRALRDIVIEIRK